MFKQLDIVILAKWALWYPFAGLFVLIALGARFGNRDDVSLRSVSVLYAIAALYFAGGLVLAIKALRRVKVEGRKGIYGRALTGLALDGLMLCITILLAGFGFHISRLLAEQKEKEAADTQTYQTAVKQATLAFGSGMKKLQTQYESSWAALTNPSVLDWATADNREELRVREKKVGEFVATCTAFSEFSKNATNIYRQELLKQHLSPKAQERLLKDFTESISGKNPQIIAIRQTDVRRAEALLTVVTFMDTTWGEWHYDPDTKQILFENTADAEKYNRNLKEFTAATDEALLLKGAMK